MRSDVIVEVLVSGTVAVGVGDGEVTVVEVPELDGGGVVGALAAAVEPGRRGGSRWSRMSSVAQAFSNSAMRL